MDDDLYCSAKEAAAALDVSLPTLYCYVSRGFVRTQRAPGARQGRYWRSDVERFKRRRALAGREQDDTIGHDSAITLITKTDLFYRGANAVALAETHSWEAVTALLWQLPEQDVFRDNLPVLPSNYAALWAAGDGLARVDKIVTLAPFMERSNPRCFDLTPLAFARAGAAAMRWIAATVADPCAPSERPIHLVLARAADEDDPVADVVRRLLVLSADHELDPTTLAVRAVANVGVTPYRLITTGLIVSSGQRGSFGRLQPAARMLDEVFASADPAAPILSRLQSGETLPGFGPSVYAGRDPRTAAMLAALEHRLGHVPDVVKFLQAIAVARDATGREPDFALSHLVVGHLIGLRGDGAKLLRLPRIAGWMAHAMEQFGEHDLVRPRTHYRGQLPP